MAMPLHIFIFLILIPLSCQNGTEDEFSEELYIRPLPTGHIYSYMQFLTKHNAENESDHHYHLFPKALGEVFQEFGVQELHLTLTQSLWRHSQWGQPMEDAPTGAQLWVWFKEGIKGVDEKWKNLINVLSGMFCASLKFMDSTVTVMPEMSFRPWGAISQVYRKYGKGYIRYAALPGEVVCTENFTPWQKLLPCGMKFGLASLLYSRKLYDSSYQSIGVHYRPVCQDEKCSSAIKELKQTLSVVIDTASRNGHQSWSLKSLFGQVLTSTCPLAQTSAVYVDDPGNNDFVLSPEPSSTLNISSAISGSQWFVYDLKSALKQNQIFEVAAKYSKQFHLDVIEPPPVYVIRTLTGFGEQHGGFMSILYNEGASPLNVIFMQIMPWFLRVFLQTLHIEAFPIGSSVVGKTGQEVKPVYMNYVPGRSRERAYFLELLLTLPPKSATRVSIEFEKALLKWTEYPPDAHHGFFVPAAVVTAELPRSKFFNGLYQNTSLLIDRATAFADTSLVRLHTKTITVTLPTPDFSMPYNVICLVCTVVAIAFGSVHNITTKVLAFKDPNRKGFVGRLKDWIRTKFGRKKKEEEVVEEEDKEEVEEDTKFVEDLPVK